ncbi:MAG TPA: hypothetical protein VGK73_28870 [Polyangiaceae bacterium]
MRAGRERFALLLLFLAAACGEEEDPADDSSDAGTSATRGGNAGNGGSSSGRGGTANARKQGGGTGGRGGSSAGTTSAGTTSAGTGGDGGAGGAGASAGTSDPGIGGVGAGEGGEGGVPQSPDCEALPEPENVVAEVVPTDADQLPSIVRAAPEGSTILLADGTYRMAGSDESSRRIQIVARGVTLRSRSGNRDAVIIDGEYQTEEIITVSASEVTIADITVRRAVYHPIHVLGGPDGDIRGVRLRNLKIVDGGEQFVKVNTSGATPNTYADDGILECSHFELTDEGRPEVVPEPGGCYTGGIDAHQARGWIVRNNRFVGIHCTNGSLAEHAIHFWTSSRDTLVERNTIVDCARGIGFGLGDGGGNPPDRTYDDDPYPSAGYIGHYDGLIRNNVIVTSPGFEYFDTGIELEQARGARVYHNTVIHGSAAFASISHRFENSVVSLENNLVRSIRARDGSSASGDSNLENAPDDLFSDLAGLDLHLAPGADAAIDRGIELEDAGDDIDGTPHDEGSPDLGADEFREP